MMRKETKENIFFRADYPGADNAKWLKWGVVKKEVDGEMSFSTEDIPCDRYKFQPGRGAEA